MELKLDDSHRCLVKRWTVFQQMKRCAEDIDHYLGEAVEETIRQLKARHGDVIGTKTDRLLQEKWFDVFPQDLKRLDDSGGLIMHFGIEGVGVSEILGMTSARPFQHYAWCPISGPEGRRLFEQFSELLRSIGFHEQFPCSTPRATYYFAKSLPALSPEQFMEPERLVASLEAPLDSLLNWYHEHASTIREFKGR